MTPWDEEVRAKERHERVLGFAFAGLLGMIQGAMGQAIPEPETARDLVRLGREVYSELDQPTEPPKEAPAKGTPPEEPFDWQDSLYLDEEER